MKSILYYALFASIPLASASAMASEFNPPLKSEFLCFNEKIELHGEFTILEGTTGNGSLSLQPMKASFPEIFPDAAFFLGWPQSHPLEVRFPGPNGSMRKISIDGYFSRPSIRHEGIYVDEQGDQQNVICSNQITLIKNNEENHHETN